MKKSVDERNLPDWLVKDWTETCAKINKNSINAKILRGEYIQSEVEDGEEG